LGKKKGNQFFFWKIMRDEESVMNRKRFAFGLSLMALLLMLITACGNAGVTSSAKPSGQSSQTGVSSAENQGNWPKELKIGYQKSSLLMIVKQKRSLEERLAPYGVHVSWFEFQSGPPLLEALNAGKIDAGYSGGAPAALAEAAPGSQMVYLAYEPEVARAIVVRKNAAIHSLADLKGKKVAFAVGSSAHYTLLSALATVGLTISDIQPVNLQPSDARTAFERGDVDAWVIWDPYLADAEVHAGARILADAKGLPRQYGFILGRREYIQQYPEIQKLLIEELSKVHQETQADPKQAATQFSKDTKIPEEIWRRTLERREYGVYPLNDDVVSAQQRIADTFYAAGLIREKIQVKDAVLSTNGKAKE
jgi:sulfonate transport system substrate-binding protein